MSICDKCVHREVCCDEGMGEEALNFCAHLLEERPKGKWIERVEHRGCYLGVKTVYSYTCPFCGVKEYEKHPFCHCGADMRSTHEE